MKIQADTFTAGAGIVKQVPFCFFNQREIKHQLRFSFRCKRLEFYSVLSPHKKLGVGLMVMMAGLRSSQVS